MVTLTTIETNDTMLLESRHPFQSEHNNHLVTLFGLKHNRNQLEPRVELDKEREREGNERAGEKEKKRKREKEDVSINSRTTNQSRSWISEFSYPLQQRYHLNVPHPLTRRHLQNFLNDCIQHGIFVLVAVICKKVVPIVEREQETGLISITITTTPHSSGNSSNTTQ